MVLEGNANYNDATAASEKQPVYLVQIAGDATWFSSRVYTNAGYLPLLKTVSGVTSRFDPIRGDASIGNFKFEILNPSNALLDLFALDDFNKAFVIVKAGYVDMDLADFEEVQGGNILGYDHNSNATGFIFTAQDLQKKMSADIFVSDTPGGTFNISPVHPMTLWLQIMTSTGAATNGPYDVLSSALGLGIDQSLVDVAQVEAERDDFYSGFEVEFTGLTAQNAKQFFQEEIYKPFALAPVIQANRIIALTSIKPGLEGYMLGENRFAELDQDDDIIGIPRFNPKFTDIVNTIIFKWDWDGDDFQSQDSIRDTDSRNKHGVVNLTIESKGITTALNGAAIAVDIGNRYLRKYALLPAVITFKTWFTKRNIEAGDQLKVTSDLLPNIDTGDLNTVDRIYEVEQITPDYRNGFMKIIARDLNSGQGKYFLIGPNDLPDFPGASAAQLAKYGWILDDPADWYLIL